jgi:magnesium transporter
MLHLLRRNAQFTVESVGPDWRLPPDADWLDLVNPTREEELAVEAALDLDLPTPEEMAQIEPSSRLYQENGATFMTATLLSRGDDVPTLAPVTFVLARGILVTIRYAPLKAFDVFATRAQTPPGLANGSEVLLGLLDAIVERLAEILEHTASHVEAASAAIFQQPKADAFQPLLRELARAQSTTSMTRTSLASLARLVSFANLAREIASDKACEAHLRTLQQDMQSLTEHAGYQSTHIAFLLDASLGLINIEQNGIIKIFSVAAVVFLPPTLVASIYGMNFHRMPELSWPLGYPLALILMVASAALPLWYFRRRGWF